MPLATSAVAPADVLGVLSRHLLVDGYDFVLDTAASRGSRLLDARDGTAYLDMFAFFASSPLGMNHPALADDDGFRRTLTEVAVNKPANSDIYSTHLAEFVTVFERVLGDPALPHLFLIEGGTLAVENALKAAFDWKQQHNAANRRDGDRGTKVLHLTSAFHGRSGYTLSLTNTEPVKVARFPKFDWPRLDTPALRFPLDGFAESNAAAERHALGQAEAAFAAFPDDIACFLAEPIQSEGGDNHLSSEFLRAMQALCRRNDALFLLDEVQTGCGASGTAWTYQQLGLEPDIVAFGKKTQVCGVMAGGRMDEVAENVFRVSSRLNSTWGGNLTDIVRSRRILEVIEADGLIDAAERLGKELADRLGELAVRHPDTVSNVRGRGLLRAFDLPDGDVRDDVLTRMRVDERVFLLGCGSRSVRFRPNMAVASDDLAAAVDALDRVLSV